MNLTKPQKLIYNMEKFAGGAIAAICGSMLANGKKNLSDIKKAINELYRLNDALRIRISETDGEVSQTVAEYTEQDIKVHCFENKAKLDAYAEDYAKKPLDFYGNLCEINIVTLPQQYGLLIKLHHIIGDAWTLSLLGTQFNKLMNGEEVAAYSYADYVESENDYIQSKRYEKDKKGVGVGDIVAIKLTRKSYLFSAMLGILKSGAAYMPIDPTYPEDRIEYMLTESKAKCCIDEDNISELLTSEDISNLNIAINRNDAFCALHTSGSTGKPKMSLLKHGGMMNFITANQRFWQGVDTVVSATIITFDAFVMDSVLSLAQGKQVVLASEDEIYNQALFEGLFRHSENNMFFSTPTKIENYIESSKDKTYLSRIKSFARVVK